MDCREVHTNLVQLISDELEAEDRAAVEQHIGSCAECSRILEESRAVAAELKQFHKGFRPSPHWRSLLLTRARLQHHVLEAATPQAAVPGGGGQVKAARASLWLAAVVLIAVVVAVPLLLLRLRGEAPPQSTERPVESVPKPTLPVEQPPPKPAAPAVPAPAVPRQEPRVPAPTRIAVKQGDQTITGTVTDIEGAPVARARIDYLAARPEREGKLRVVHKTVTDRLGRYKIVREESETTRRWTGLIAVLADGYAASMAYVPHRLVDNDNVFVNFKLSPGKTITGRVLDRFGDPVFGARVAPGFAHVTRDANILVALSDSDGNFHVDNVPADAPITLFCEAPGNAPTLVDTPEEGGEVAVTLGEPAKIRGRVTAPGATATVRIEFAKTELTPQNLAGWLERETETGPGGHFEFGDLPAGTYQLSAAVDGYPLATARADLTGTREAYAQLDPVRNDLGIVRGTVRNPEGNPVKATAYAEGMTVETDDAGRFEMRLVVGGHEVGAYSGPVLVSGLQRVTVDRVGPGQDLDLTLHRRPAVEATVVDAAGQPVVETTVTAVSRSSPHFDAPAIEAGVISLDGLVTVSDLDPEERTEITFEDFATGNSETITLTLDWDERRAVTVHLGELYAEVEGVVEDAFGRPLAGASVLTSRVPDRVHLSSVETDESGGFALRELKPSETYRLQVSAEGFAMAQPGFEFVPRDVTSLRVVRSSQSLDLSSRSRSKPFWTSSTSNAARTSTPCLPACSVTPTA